MVFFASMLDVRKWSLIMLQTGAEEIVMGCENFTDLVVGV